MNVSHAYLQGPPQVDARLDSHVVRGLEKCPLEEQSKEEQDSQHIGICQELLRGDEIDPQQLHLQQSKPGPEICQCGFERWPETTG